MLHEIDNFSHTLHIQNDVLHNPGMNHKLIY